MQKLDLADSLSLRAALSDANGHMGSALRCSRGCQLSLGACMIIRMCVIICMITHTCMQLLKQMCLGVVDHVTCTENRLHGG